MPQSEKEIRVGDLVTLQKVEKASSLALWDEWCDDEKNDSVLKNWPRIAGRLSQGEIAIVLEISPGIKRQFGAKICTKNNVVGWISVKCLRKANGDPERCRTSLS